MPWVEALLRGQKVLARADEAGGFVNEGGRVEIRYKPSDGRSYRAALANLEPKPGGKTFPDDHCAPAEAAPPKAQEPAKGSGNGSGKGWGPVKAAASRALAVAPAPTESRDAYIVYTDGACSGNPGPAGCGFIIVAPGGSEVREGNEYLGETTNNVAELTAILRGVEGVPDAGAHVRVHTDSSYAIGVLQKGWKAKANPELVAKIRAELQRRQNVHLVYVPGHVGVPLNERADELAREAVRTRTSRRLA